MSLALEMLTPFPERGWGRVTELAKLYHISRTLLYEMRDRALCGLLEALASRDPGPQPEPTVLTVDEAFIQRAIAILPTLSGTVRGIQQGLDLLFHVSRSVGFISQTLATIGAQAAAYNATLSVPLPMLAEADEIFQGRQVGLTIVDGRSFLILSLTPAEARDGTTWGLAFLDLQERGIQFQDLASDGGTGIQAGIQAAQLVVPLRPDLFHLLREAHRLRQRLERAAERAMRVAERARQAEREAQAPKRRRGPRLKVSVPLAEVEAQEAQAINIHDLYVWLINEVRQALEPIIPDGRLTVVAEARATVETAIELLTALNHAEISEFARQLQKHLDALLAPLAWLEQTLAPYRQGLDPASEALILCAWQHRQALALVPGEGFPSDLQPIVRAFWTALSLFHRSSSLAESLHSWLRPYLQLHRGMPKWLLSLLQLFWNHHEFSRGKRAGSSPVQLAGVPDAPSLSEALDQVLGSQPSATGQPVKLYTLAEVFGLESSAQPAVQPA